MDTLTIFVAVTAAAVAIQAGILVALYLAVRQTAARTEALASEVKTKFLPVADMVVELRPKIENIVNNASAASDKVRAQIEKLDVTVNETLDRARMQVIRTDELITRALNGIGNASETVQRSVSSPARHLSGLMQGLSTGLEVFFSSRRRRRDGAGVAQDEMFI